MLRHNDYVNLHYRENIIDSDITLYTHTSQETLIGFASFWLHLCVSQTYSTVNLEQEGRAQEGEMGRSDVGRLTQAEVPQKLGNI